MPLLLLLAGAGIQAPIPVATGTICGVVVFTAYPIGAVEQHSPVGAITGPELIVGSVMGLEPISGSITQIRATGDVQECD